VGRKNTLKNYSILNAQSAAASFNTFAMPTNIDYLDNVSIQVTWTGTPVGTFDVYVSNVLHPSTTLTSDWSRLDFGSTPAIDSTNSDMVINLNQIPFSWIAVVYTKTSGTGTISAITTIKTVGA
jgi:hypothetical protein